MPFNSALPSTTRTARTVRSHSAWICSRKHQRGFQRDGHAHAISAKAVAVATRHEIKGSTKVPVRFAIQYRTNFGDMVSLVGGGELFGNWNTAEAPLMTWNEGDVWVLEVAVPPGMHEFKFVVRRADGQCVWEDGDNRKIEVPEDSLLVMLESACLWGATGDTPVQSLSERMPLLDDSGIHVSHSGQPSNDEHLAPMESTVLVHSVDEPIEEHVLVSNVFDDSRNGAHQAPADAQHDQVTSAVPAAQPQVRNVSADVESSDASHHKPELASHQKPELASHQKPEQSDIVAVSEAPVHVADISPAAPEQGQGEKQEQEPPLLGALAAAAALLAVPVVAWSEYTLRSTGCGLPPGPGGSLGALEGVSYLLVASLAISGCLRQLRGEPPSTGPLGAARAASYVAVAAGAVVLVLQVKQYGFIPSALPDRHCFGGEGDDLLPHLTVGLQLQTAVKQWTAQWSFQAHGIIEQAGAIMEQARSRSAGTIKEAARLLQASSAQLQLLTFEWGKQLQQGSLQVQATASDITHLAQSGSQQLVGKLQSSSVTGLAEAQARSAALLSSSQELVDKLQSASLSSLAEVQARSAALLSSSQELVGKLQSASMSSLAEAQARSAALLSRSQELVGKLQSSSLSSLGEAQARSAALLSSSKELVGKLQSSSMSSLVEGQARAAALLSSSKELAGELQSSSLSSLAEGQARAAALLSSSKELAGELQSSTMSSLAEAQARSAALLSSSKELAGELQSSSISGFTEAQAKSAALVTSLESESSRLATAMQEWYGSMQASAHK